MIRVQPPHRRSFLKTLAAPALATCLARETVAATRPPNIVLILADDLGYGDLGCYGSNIKTPHIDGLARDGVLFRQFCAASPVCSPSRASFLTGRYGVKTGVHTVLSPGDGLGLGETEVTLPQLLKRSGYRTAAVGKWHLGAQPGQLPCRRGFDEFYGLPFSSDQSSTLIQNQDVLDPNVRLDSLTRRFTEQAVSFIRRSKDAPFFLYLAHTAPHMPLAPAPPFRGRSGLGLYADVVEELDTSVGQVLLELTANGLDANTLVLFVSDNGPWFQGSAGRTRGRKGDTFDGGMRVPFLARWRGRIPTGKVISGFASGLDLLPTLANLAQATPPAGIPPGIVDGVDIWPMLAAEANSVERPPFLYFDSWNLQAVRAGRWKLHLTRYNSPAYTPEPKVGRFNLPLLNPELYDLDADPSESSDIADEHPEIVRELRARVDRMLPDMPLKVRDAWDETFNRPVLPNVSGAWPVPILEQ